jgi:hypothetical protein
MRAHLLSVACAVLLLGACGAQQKTSSAGGRGGGGDGGGSGETGGAGAGGAAGSGGSPAKLDAATTPAGSGGVGGGGAPTPDAAPPVEAAAAAVDVAVDDPGPPGAYPICPKCKPIFDGKTLDGWQQDPAGSFVVKAGAIASTGKGAHAWTKDDFGDFRIFLTVRQIMGSHKPCTTLFCTRPANGTATRGLSGIQFQPPLGGSWDYRPGKNSGPDMVHWMYPNPRPMFDVSKWNRCEVLARASTGEFRAACCEIEGKTSCKAQEVVHYKDPTAGKKGPFTLMMHNGGLFDEYKDLWVETDPVGDELLSTK